MRIDQPHYSRTDRLDYIQSMLGQLHTMAQGERCDVLTYFIEMAYVECSDIIRGQRPRRLDQETATHRKIAHSA